MRREGAQAPSLFQSSLLKDKICYLAFKRSLRYADGSPNEPQKRTLYELTNNRCCPYGGKIRRRAATSPDRAADASRSRARPAILHFCSKFV
jgi:hypothetical protein